MAESLGPLAAWLEKAGSTQADLARSLGVSQAQVSQWVDGTSLPRAETLVLLSELTGISIDELVRFKVDTSGRG
jgi:transcriptional regulator with XRE-family HTH domain